MSSPAPIGWKQQIEQGLGEGEVIGETKSRYYNLLLAIHASAEKRRIPFAVLMIDIMEDYLREQGVEVD